MKKHFPFIVILSILAFGGISVSAQCNPNTASPIKCSYYNEGYQDGENDARNNRNSDYRRYKNKYNRNYEDFFRNGYQAGYDSFRPGTRWTNSQRSAYDSGYTIGQNDRRRSNQNRSNESNGSQYDQNIGQYFQQGYADGFSDRPRQYDVPVIGVTPTYPPVYPPIYPPNPGGGVNGSATWSGRVDDRANIILRGNTIYAENVSGNLTQTTYQNVNGALPRRAATINVRRTDGRGNVAVFQQPSNFNNFTAIVQIYDSKSGSDNYKIDITWTAQANVEEPYSPGRVTWRGRVDQTVNIIISGGDVQSVDTAGTGLSNVNFKLTGYLAYRPGSVNVRRENGRGTVSILQQPSRNNDYTAIVQIFDPKSGADNYEVEISW